MHCDLDINRSLTKREKLLNLLQEYCQLFQVVGESPGHTKVARHHIHTDGPPIKQPLRRLPESVEQVVSDEVSTMLDQGVIRRSYCPWSSPMILVKKKDNSWRFCLDYRKINAITKKDAYPLPRIDSTLESLSGSQYFTTLHMASGYWQMEIEKEDKKKTAFTTPNGHFEFNIMPFGLTNAPASFQQLMECVLAGLSPEQCLDDVIIFSPNFDEHLEQLRNVFDRLATAGLKLKTTKCKTLHNEAGHMGYRKIMEKVKKRYYWPHYEQDDFH